MLSRNFAGKLVLIVIATSLILGASVRRVLSGPPEFVKVLISYNSKPGLLEEARVRLLGGQVRYRYHLINTIAASLPESAVSHLLGHPKVARIEPDIVIHALEIDLDTELDNAWGVSHIGAGLVHNDNHGEGVNIAIIDSGINYDHPDLDDNYIANGSYDFADQDNDPWDVYGHGTHVAGTACAENNDNGLSDPPYGVVGVAPECNLFALKVLDDNGMGFSSDLIGALEWAVEKGIHVANLSLGWDQEPPEAVEQAFIEAERAGIVIVAAACNNGNRAGKGENVCYPGKYASVIAVAAIDEYNNRATFSSTGIEVELAAPGVSVFSTWNNTTSYATPTPVCHTEEEMNDVCYKYGSGTSMASPHVAGVAALIIAAGIEDADNDGVINDDVRQRLTATADDLDNPLWYGYGLVNAVKAAESTTPPVPVIDIAVTDMQGPASVEQGVMVPFVVEVKNVGTVSIQSDIEVELTDHTVNALIGEKTIYGLKVRESTQLIYDWDTATADLGNHTISASIKLSDEIVWNNTYDKVVTVTESGVTPLSVAYLDPDTIDTNAQTDVTVFGSGLAPKAVVTFFDGKGVAPVATTIGVSEDGTRLYLKVTTRLTPKPVSWTVRVTNPNGDSALLVDGLTVQP